MYHWQVIIADVSCSEKIEAQETSFPMGDLDFVSRGPARTETFSYNGRSTSSPIDSSRNETSQATKAQESLPNVTTPRSPSQPSLFRPGARTPPSRPAPAPTSPPSSRVPSASKRASWGKEGPSMTSAAKTDGHRRTPSIASLPSYDGTASANSSLLGQDPRPVKPYREARDSMVLAPSQFQVGTKSSDAEDPGCGEEWLATPVSGDIRPEDFPMPPTTSRALADEQYRVSRQLTGSGDMSHGRSKTLNRESGVFGEFSPPPIIKPQ